MASANAEGRYLWGEHTDHHRQHAYRRAAADLDFLLPHIWPGAGVVDLGCGPGSLTCDVAEMVAPGPVLGIDISAQAVAIAEAAARERGLTNVGFRVGDAESTGLSDASMDVVFSSGMLSYLRAPERALAESYRLLSPGGVFGAREMAKQGDWYAGPHAEVRSLMLRAMIIGMQGTRRGSLPGR